MTQKLLMLIITFSMLGESTQISASCNATPLTVPAGGATISAPGYYCLTGDTTGTITINANDVTLDLNNHTISLPSDSGADGVDVNPGFSRITIKNGNIVTPYNGIGLFGDTGDSDFYIYDVTIDGASLGISAGRLANLTIARVIITNSSDFGFSIGSASNVTLSACNVTNVSGGNGFNILGVPNSSMLLDSCIATNAASGFAITGTNVTLTHCLAQNCGSGFSIGNTITNITTDIALVDCTANFNGGKGFYIAGSNTTLTDCMAQGNGTSDSANCAGFFLETTSNNTMLANCSANLNIGNAGTSAAFFNWTTVGPSSFIACTAQNNAIEGFNMINSTGVGIIKSCVAKGNSACGFDDASTSSLYQYVANVAEGNGDHPGDSVCDTNYCLGGDVTTFSSHGPGPTPYFQFIPNTPATATAFTPTFWNNITLP